MPKLHLKRTPTEEAEHQWRKAHKTARKAAKKSKRPLSTSVDDASGDDEPSGSGSHWPPRPKRQRTPEEEMHTWDEFDDENPYGPPPPLPKKHKPDFEDIRARLEEERFREKMAGAFEDDERLDSVGARFNDFAHVPGRWRDVKVDAMDDDLGTGVDPRHMDEDDYAEWIRIGMWRYKHADEHAEQQRQKAAKAARREQEKRVKEETARIERAAEEERKARKLARESRKWDEARETYEARWKDLLTGDDELRFEDIPWPVVAAYSSSKRSARVVVDDLTPEAICAFVVPLAAGSSEAELKKERRDKLRETMLRFHPDKFEGRVMRRVREKDRDRTVEAVGYVARALNTLMAESP
ncbi:hypothetical protein PLICRDRAFT_99074 [Plicaturopsis crispa FD-325 SS-3]|nr:hypothetical protein PLICRDRAFT_99074 [Plicaturopsis crispa FD-325 SS-3]